MKDKLDVIEDKIDRVFEETQNNLEAAHVSIAALTSKVINLANKLDEHMRERDAHNPGIMRGK